MKKSENAFKIVTAGTQYLPVSFKSKKITQSNYSKTFICKRNIFYYFYLGKENISMIFCLKSFLKTRLRVMEGNLGFRD